jgi:hypothetical protein
VNLYAYCAGEPLGLVDRDGRNFTVIVDFKNQTMVLASVTVVHTVRDRDQVRAAVSAFNAFPAFHHNGMKVTFDVQISLEPRAPRPDPSSPILRNEYTSQAWRSFAPKHVNSQPSSPGGPFSYTGGATQGGRNIVMNIHDQFGSLGNVPDFVKHEIGHTFGLDDPGRKYHVPGGLMDNSVITGFFGSRDPTGANNVPLRMQEASMVMKFISEYGPQMNDPRPGNKGYVPDTPVVVFVHSRAPGAKMFRTLDAITQDYLDQETRRLTNMAADPPALVRELPSLSQQPGTGTP